MAERDTRTYLKVINSVLAAGFILMLGSYTGISLDATGNFFADKENPICEFNHRGETNSIPMERCCYHASQQLKIDEEKDRYFYGSSNKNYSLNQDAVGYCREEGFNIE